MNAQPNTPGAIVAIANQKGGVGKTTLAIHLAAYLSRQGLRAILVDADPQGNASSWLLDGDTSQSGLFDLLVVGKPLGQCLRPVRGRWNIGLLPGNLRTGEAYTINAALGKPFDTLARALRPLAGYCHYVILDMPPSRLTGFRETLYAADWVIVPTQLERLSLEGVTLMARTCVDLQDQHGNGPRLLGIVPNMVRRGVTEHQAQLDELLNVFADKIWPPVTQTVHIAEASSRGLTMFDYAPNHDVTQALATIAQRLVANTSPSPVSRFGTQERGPGGEGETNATP